MTPPEETAALERGSLAPCPMCDAPARFVWGLRDQGSVKCTRPSCGTRGGSFDHERNAIAAWNTRTSDPAPARRAEAAEKRVGELEAGLAPFANGAGYFDQRYDDDGKATAKPYSDNTNAGYGGVQVKHYRAARALITPIAEGR